MEPMTLGSAPSSPSSPTTHPNFLPAFLLGESQPAQASTPNPSHSPGRSRNASGYRMGLPANTPEPRTLQQKLFRESSSDASFQSPYIAKNDKPGPPKQGLFDTIGKKTVMSPLAVNTSAQQTSLNESAVNDSYPGNESLWVSVFGFTPASFSAVMGHFACVGNVLEKRHPAQGNWVHLKYSTFDEVMKALQFNGKVITPGVMVGVCACNVGKENVNVVSPERNLNLSRARSLRRSVVPTGADFGSSPQNVPQRSTGLVTKAMEYVFGW